MNCVSHSSAENLKLKNAFNIRAQKILIKTKFAVQDTTYSMALAIRSASSIEFFFKSQCICLTTSTGLWSLPCLGSHFGPHGRSL